jgi:hypothetical protein
MKTHILANLLFVGVSLVQSVGGATTTNATALGIVAGNGGWHSSGVFCFSSFAEEKSQLTVLRVTPAPTVLLKTNLQDTVKPPICTSTSVIVVTVAGRIQKFSHSGTLEFDETLPNVTGACGLAGKITDSHIYVTETTYLKKKPRYRLHLFDISGTAPRRIAEFRLRRMGPIMQYRGYLVILGAKDASDVEVQRLALPKGIGWFN